MKNDKELGQEVHQHLVDLGIETPFKSPQVAAKESIAYHFEHIMLSLGLDLTDDSLEKSPHRMAKMFCDEIFEGLNYDNFPRCMNVNNKFHADEMIIVGGVDVSSTCEHHFQNIEGEAKVAYIPKDRVLGLSKINRIVRFFSKRPQIQERLTLQIQAALCYVLDTDNVAVEIRAVHHCVKARGIEDKNSWTTTRKLGGVFKAKAEARNEFLKSK